MAKNGVTWQYTYDVNGLRTKRTNGSTTYNYIYNGSQLVQMTVGENTLEFFYDASGAPVMVLWNGTPYYYVTSLQGDVLLIMDIDGELVVSYDYDAWGNILSAAGTLASTLGTLNPLRYRGCVYDAETGLYYLQSRYYNPEWGRFINADAFVSTGQGLLGNNMFAYCDNNPVNKTDPSGKIPDSLGGFAGQETGRAIYEWITGEEHPSRETDALEEQVRMTQIRSFKKGVKLLWDAYQYSIELETKEQFEKDMEVIEVTEFLADNPLIAVDVVTGTVGTGLTYVGVASVCAGVSIPVVGQVAMGVVGLACGIWGVYRVFELIYENIK